MSSLEAIVEDLKALPPDTLEAVASFIRQLKPPGDDQKRDMLSQLFGSLSEKDAEAMKRAIEDGCETIDERGW